MSTTDTPLTDAELRAIILTCDGRGSGEKGVALEMLIARRVSQLEAQLAEARKDSERLANADRLAVYSGKDGRRDWWSGGAWMYPGDEIILLDAQQSTQQ